MAQRKGRKLKQVQTSQRTFKRLTRIKEFAKEFSTQCRRHGDKPGLALLKEISEPGKRYAPKILQSWAYGQRLPRGPNSFGLLKNLEIRYGLERDHFRSILYPMTPTELTVHLVSSCQQNVIRRHLPSNYDALSKGQQNQIVDWLKRNVLHCATEYGAHMRGSSTNRYGLHFPHILDVITQVDPDRSGGSVAEMRSCRKSPKASPPRLDIPERLVEEIRELIKFKCSAVAPANTLRTTVWGQVTALNQIRDCCRMFGALVASPTSEFKGYGASGSSLTLALFMFPAFWDWFLGWQEARRGFFTVYERCVILAALAHARSTGWIRQSPHLAYNLGAISGMISDSDIRAAIGDWDATCNRAVTYLLARSRELERVVQVHRDSFAPILTVLNSDQPLLQYRKIADEILRRFPDEKRHPLEAAERGRDYLLIRFGMHLGLRRRNLSQLLVCPPGQVPKSDTYLRKQRRGEMRWLKDEGVWEVYIPSMAFKNANSRFFRGSPYRAILSDVADLYEWIERYLVYFRPRLLKGHVDPTTFFVRTMDKHYPTAEFAGNGLTAHWRTTIIRFGIYNPFTRRGAIEGLLPHGPHSIRDVIATHLVKQTSSYELAAYALHSTPRSIEKHYCRFLAEEKIAIACKALNKIWEKQPATIRQRDLQAG